jgi:hypothetical protein
LALNGDPITTAAASGANHDIVRVSQWRSIRNVRSCGAARKTFSRNEWLTDKTVSYHRTAIVTRRYHLSLRIPTDFNVDKIQNNE